MVEEDGFAWPEKRNNAIVSIGTMNRVVVYTGVLSGSWWLGAMNELDRMKDVVLKR